MKSSKNIKVPEKIVDQVLGQDEAVKIIKKAAQQRRHVFLIGEPGTGKSMLGLALAELIPKSDLKDILSYPNPNDENNPSIKTTPAGKGRDEVKKYQMDAKQAFKNNNFLLIIVAIFTLIAPWWARHYYKSDLMFTAFFLGGMLFLAAFAIMTSMGPKMFQTQKTIAPKVIVDNFDKKQAPFFDATGAHAGALLGDVLHDPFQSLRSGEKINFIDDKGNLETGKIGQVIDKQFAKYPHAIVKKKEKNYEAVFLPKNKLSILGETNGSISPVEVLSSNRYDYDGEMIRLTTSEGKKLIVTPEHMIAILENEKINCVEAKDIKKGDTVVAKSKDIIIDEQDIINTYDERQQEQCKLYYQYKEIKAKKPSWGYKRIAKTMNQPYGKTRWWHEGKHIPTPIQTANWLRKRGLLPLKIDNPKLPFIAKVLGATFGDGGIFENLNAIFLSSSELEATQEFGNDLMFIFGYSIDNNMRTIRGGINETSLCYQNTNRNIIRFFKALGAPIGKKTNTELNVPQWTYLNRKWKKEFFGSLLGSELGVPKIHVSNKHLNTFDFAITGNPHLRENRLLFLTEIKEYLEEGGVKTSEPKKRALKEKRKFLFRLLISTKFKSVNNFTKNIKINYCTYKQQKLVNTLNEFKIIKKEKYSELIERGYGAESAMNLLNLTPQCLYTILNDEEIVT